MQLPVDVLCEITKYLFPCAKLALSHVNTHLHRLKDIPRRRDIERKKLMLRELEAETAKINIRIEGWKEKIDRCRYVCYLSQGDYDSKHVLFETGDGNIVLLLPKHNSDCNKKRLWRLALQKR